MFDLLANIEWRQLPWLFLVLQPFVLWLVLNWLQKQQQQKFADEHLLPWLRVEQDKTLWQKVFSRNTAYSLAWLFFALSLAGPRLPEKAQKAHNEIIVDVMLVVDVSRSMLATDIKPSRLRRATLEIVEFLSMAKNTRVGITVYAARPHLFVPLTADFKALKFYLNSLDKLQLPTRGSDASAAITFAEKELQTNITDHKQAIIWLNDGDIEAATISALKTNLQQASSAGIDTYILGLGTPEGAAIPLPEGGWLEVAGQAVISKLDAKLLQQLAEKGNGLFTRVSNDGSDWKALYKQGIIKSLKPAKQKDTAQWQELFPWVLLPAIFFLLVALMPLSMRSKNTSTTLVVIFTMASILNTLPADAKEKNDFLSSVEQGINAYKKSEFGQSKGYFITSVLNAHTEQERAIALHNLGNTLFQAGDYARAAEIFTDALRYAPKQQQTINNQKLTIAISIELEKRRNRVFNRGNFAAPNDNAPLFDLPEQIPFMLSTKAVNLLKVTLPKLPDATLNRLLEKNMQRFKLMQGDEKLTAKKKIEQQDVEQARLYLMGLEEQTTNALWKRLFEIEEGFPGKLKEPKELPGVRPW